MFISRYALPLVGILAWFVPVCAGDLNPAALAYTLPADIKWVESPQGSAQAILAGDPNKPGLYAVLTKWHAHHNSRPHFHQNDRFITVISGT